MWSCESRSLWGQSSCPYRSSPFRDSGGGGSYHIHQFVNGQQCILWHQEGWIPHHPCFHTAALQWPNPPNIPQLLDEGQSMQLPSDKNIQWRPINASLVLKDVRVIAPKMLRLWILSIWLVVVILLVVGHQAMHVSMREGLIRLVDSNILS